VKPELTIIVRNISVYLLFYSKSYIGLDITV